ncbi:MAG: YraN family protein [Gammaproteobacteria bacterium]
MDTKHARGRHAEELACRYLERQGLRLLERNYRCARGEIDLIMQHGEILVFVEVRYRRSSVFGSGAESVDWRKRQRLTETALHYMQARKAAARPARFDVISVSPGPDRDNIHWIPNAFHP